MIYFNKRQSNENLSTCILYVVLIHLPKLSFRLIQKSCAIRSVTTLLKCQSTLAKHTDNEHHNMQILKFLG